VHSTTVSLRLVITFSTASVISSPSTVTNTETERYQIAWQNRLEDRVPRLTLVVVQSTANAIDAILPFPRELKQCPPKSKYQ